MDLDPKHLAEKPKVIGHTSKGIRLYSVRTHGGFNLILKSSGKSFEVVGAGNHPAIAKFAAQNKLDNNVTWDELSKADWVDPITFEHLLPKYQKLTDMLNEEIQRMNNG